MTQDKKNFFVQKEIFEYMRLEVKDAAPREACGLISSDDRKQRIYPIRNISEGENSFIMDPQQLVDALLDIRARDAKILCIFHSHPNSSGTPSRTDITQNTFSDVVHLIWSQEKKKWRCRAFQYTVTGFIEIKLEIG